MTSPNYAIENYNVVKALYLANLNTHVAAVRTEQGLGTSFKDVKEFRGEKGLQVSFPSVAFRTGDAQFGPMTDALPSAQDVEAILAAQHPNPVTLEEHMRGYEVAMMRTATGVTDTALSHQLNPRRTNKSPQYGTRGTTGDTLTQRVGVVISVSRIEGRR